MNNIFTKNGSEYIDALVKEAVKNVEKGETVKVEIGGKKC